MKNFTNNFKQFTSRLSARWLIMALMLLVGTSSAWAKIIYFQPTVNWWTNDGARFDAWVWGSTNADAWFIATKPSGSDYYQFSVPDDATGMKILRKNPSEGHNWNTWGNGAATGDLDISKNNFVNNSGSSCYPSSVATNYDLNSSSGNTIRLSDSEIGLQYNLYNGATKVSGTTKEGTGDALTWTISTAGTYTVKAGNSCLSEKSMSGSYTYSPCTPATSITSAELQDGTISLEGNFNTCGAKYHGFQWRKSTAEWCNDGDESQDFSNYVKLGETEGGDGEEGFFTPKSGVTYVFRTYIYNNGSWIYSSESAPVEVPCPTIASPNIIISDEVCPNKEISLSDYNNGVDGVLWYSDQEYTPATIVTINSETAFYARIKDGNCYSDAATLTLTLTNFTVPEKPQLEEYSKGICANETAEITISGYNDSYNYDLYKDEDKVGSPVFANGVFTVSEAGSYTIKAVEQECNIESTPSDPFNLTVNGTTITQSPEVVHPYEVVTFTAGEQAKWALYTNPSSGSQLSDDDAKYSGKDTAYITKGESTTTKFKGEVANGYVIHATVGDCTASYTFNVVEDPNNCQ